jgi:putative methionine-R-sulfoxide reductase with GAF domain
MESFEYCSRVGLDVEASEVEAARASIYRALDKAKAASLPSTPTSLAKLYQFKVPKLSPDGTCAAFDDLADLPYDVSAVLGGRSFMSTTRLMTLDALVEHCAVELAAGWVGIYQARETPSGAALVKLAYRGIASRAEFPLTPEFAVNSNNSTVALTGRANVINDVQGHLAAGGAYYECDPRVKAEACLPVINDSGVVGLIDAEHSVANWFDSKRLALLVALALELPTHLPSGGLTVS